MRIVRLAVVLAMMFFSSASIARSMPELTVFPSTGVEAIEPALDDYVSFQWKAPQNTSSPVSVVILMEDAKGTIKDAVTSKAYKQVGEAAFGSDQQAAARWPAKGQSAAEIPAARLRVGIKWADGHIEMSDSYVTVAPTVSDLGVGPEYHLEHKGRDDYGVFYTLSTEVRSCKVSIAGETFACLPQAGRQAVFDIVLKNGAFWRGAALGTDKINAVTEPKAGPRLQIKDVQFWRIRDGKAERCDQTNEYSEERLLFTPDKGDKLEVRFRVCEPVKRLHATEGYVTAYVCEDEYCRIDALIADRQAVVVDNDPSDGKEEGWNTISWDGRGPSGALLGSDWPMRGLSLYVRDNAGVGCESALTHAKFEISTTREMVERLYFDEAGKGVLYIDARPGDTITWKHKGSGSAAGTGVGKTDRTGLFKLRYKPSKGVQVFAVTASSPGKADLVGRFQIGQYRLISKAGNDSAGSPYSPIPYERNSFCPDKGETVKIDFIAECEDSVEWRVYSEHTCGTWPCPDSPAPLSEYLGDSVRSHDVVVGRHAVKNGLNTVVWDGRDAKGRLVEPGIYSISVWQGMGAEFSTYCVVRRSQGPKLISGVKTSSDGYVSVSWNTATPTTGALITDQRCMPVLESAKSHTVRVSPQLGETGPYWIVARDSAGRLSTAQVDAGKIGSRTKTKKVEPDVLDGDIWVAPLSETSIRVGWHTKGKALGRVRYARVGESLSGLKWQVAAESKASKVHIIVLTGLSADSDYVVDVQTARTASFAGALSWGYRAACTKLHAPSVKILSPDWRETVSGPFDIVVQASDSVHRQFANGIAEVTVSVEGCESEDSESFFLTDPDHAPGSDLYIFHADSAKIGCAVPTLQASATDEFGGSWGALKTILVRGKGLPAQSGQQK